MLSARLEVTVGFLDQVTRNLHLVLEPREGLLGFPGPRRRRREEQIHLLESPLVGLGIESPYYRKCQSSTHGLGGRARLTDRNTEDVDGAENVHHLLVDRAHDVWEKQSECSK